MKTIKLGETEMEVEEITQPVLVNHYFGGRFRCWYNVQFARAADGHIYRTAPAEPTSYPEEAMLEAEWKSNDDVIFCDDTHVSPPAAWLIASTSR